MTNAPGCSYTCTRADLFYEPSLPLPFSGQWVMRMSRAAVWTLADIIFYDAIVLACHLAFKACLQSKRLSHMGSLLKTP
jgi:hypothetical protein